MAAPRAVVRDSGGDFADNWEERETNAALPFVGSLQLLVRRNAPVAAFRLLGF
jgi:hypothetical protein